MIRLTYAVLLILRAWFRRELLDGLRKRGFKLNSGFKGTGFGLLAWKRAGGYYLGAASPAVANEDLRLKKLVDIITDVGGSQLIIDGKIKLKNDSQIKGFTETGLKFENGSELPADVVVFATGCVYLYLLGPYSCD